MPTDKLVEDILQGNRTLKDMDQVDEKKDAIGASLDNINRMSYTVSSKLAEIEKAAKYHKMQYSGIGIGRNMKDMITRSKKIIARLEKY